PKLSRSRRPRRRGQAARAAIQDFRRRPDRPAEGVERGGRKRQVIGLCFVEAELSPFPSPLWGGVRGGGDCVRQRRRVIASPPSPPPPPQGGGGAPGLWGGSAAGSRHALSLLFRRPPPRTPLQRP